jgi:hypothetical protein
MTKKIYYHKKSQAAFIKQPGFFEKKSEIIRSRPRQVGHREYGGPAEDASHAVRSPAAVFLIAACNSSLKTGSVSLSSLDGTDKVGFFHLSSRDAHFFSYCFNFFNSHVRSLN